MPKPAEADAEAAVSAHCNKKRGHSMPMFTFEIKRHGETSIFTESLSISDAKGIWCHVEVFALRFKHRFEGTIQVKNFEDEIIIRTGVATALASIEKCRCVICPLKHSSDRNSAIGRHVDPSLLALVDRLHCGAFIVSRSGEVVALNASTETFLNDGLTVVRGRLVSARQTHQRALDDFMDTLLNRQVESVEALMLPRLSGKRPLILQAMPLAKEFFPGHFFEKPSLVLILVLDLEKPDTSSCIAGLRSLGLTPTEIRVAALIGAGFSPQAASDYLGVKVDTVRTHLKKIYLKLGLSRQADLVQLVTRLGMLR
jgi:DNA-binding CsgD family transcriptional regulator